MNLEPLSPFGNSFGRTTLLAGSLHAGATLHERSDIGAVIVTCAVEAGAVAAIAGKAAGVALPGSAGPCTGVALPGSAGPCTGGALRRAIWLSPRSWLVQCPPADEQGIAARICDAFPDKLVHAMPYGDGLCWFELSGPGASGLLAQGGFVSLERSGLGAGHAKRTLLAGIAVLVLRTGGEDWLLGVERSRADYFMLWTRSAADGAAALCPTRAGVSASIPARHGEYA